MVGLSKNLRFTTSTLDTRDYDVAFFLAFNFYDGTFSCVYVLYSHFSIIYARTE